MTTEKPKTKVGKFLQSKFAKTVGSVIVRPGVKILFPFIGTPLVELASNLLGAKKKDPVTGAEVPKHSYLSLGMQILIAACVVYAFWTKNITIQEVVDILKQFLPAPDCPVQ